MAFENLEKIPTQDYSVSEETLPVYRIKVRPEVTPIDMNVQFIIKEGWNQTDRLRFHTGMKIPIEGKHPLTKIIEHMKPHILLRRYDIEEDSFIAISIFVDGEIFILSNDKKFAKKYLSGLFLNFPPAFYTTDQLEFSEEGWVVDGNLCAMFIGMLMGAIGWDPLLQIPPAIHQSLDEAGKALSIANYRSCVVMCRRTIEALLKFAFPRLLGTEAKDTRGRTLSMYSMIERFKGLQPLRIPIHLLHLLDSIRLIGNVSGAHAVEIKGYQFSKSDAEYALATVHYFLEQYFSKIDKEVTKYYTLTIDLNDEKNDE